MPETKNKSVNTVNEDGLGGLQALVERAGTNGKNLPPVDKWHPEYCGKLDIVIKRDGSWFYMGTPIGRQRLVKLFATVLRKDDDGKTYLVTPVEKIEISVEDAHFIAVEMDCGNDANEQGATQVLTFRTNVGDVVEASAENPLRFVTVKENGGVKPYIVVRGRLEALLARSVMYELISKGEELEVDGEIMFVVRSHGQVFPIMTMTDLNDTLMQEDNVS